MYFTFQVPKTKRGCRLLLNVVFQEVAKELGIRLQIVTYRERSFSEERDVLLRWSKKSRVLNCFKISLDRKLSLIRHYYLKREVECDRIYYVDVCAETYSSLKRSNYYPAAMGQPASSAQKVF